VDTIRENLYKLRMDIDMTPLQREQLEKKIEQMGIESDIMKNQRSHSAYDLSKAASESEFYQGMGGEIEHWLKMLGISMPGINLFRGPDHVGLEQVVLRLSPIIGLTIVILKVIMTLRIAIIINVNCFRREVIKWLIERE